MGAGKEETLLDMIRSLLYEIFTYDPSGELNESLEQILLNLETELDFITFLDELVRLGRKD